VLCWNCQNGKRFNGGVCPHQLETRRDYPPVGVEASASKRSDSAPAEYDIVRSLPKGEKDQLFYCWHS
jgi:hypothetical protein